MITKNALLWKQSNSIRSTIFSKRWVTQHKGNPESGSQVNLKAAEDPEKEVCMGVHFGAR